ncbi:MAG: SpoIIE family protein phosphatase [Candidatus Riflebacteria bacterium]|nr:SpoIIE family protein phosphatase [Candidatus Riflebacteria bacterium]
MFSFSDKRNLFFSSLPFLLLVLFLAVFSEKTFWIDNLFIDLSQRILYPFREASPEICIISVDDKTLKELNLSWPLSRGFQADILAMISKYSPKIIVCDILYQHPEKINEGEGDRKLASTVRRLGNVALISLLEPSETSYGFQILQFKSMNEIRKFSLFEGFVWSLIDRDEKIRYFVAQEGRMDLLSLAAKAARHLNPSVRLPGIASEQLSRSIVAFPGKNGGIPVYSAIDLINGKLSVNQLQNKVVFLGVGTEIQRDRHFTAIGEISGTLLLASSLDTILNDRIIEPFPNRLWFYIMLVSGSIAGVFLYGKILFPALAGIIFVSVSFFIHFFLPIGSFITAWVGCTFIVWLQSLYLSILSVNKKRHEAEVVGEIQSRFFPQKIWKSDVNGFECKGFCISCEKAGGDYYDYFVHEDKSLVFMLGDVTGHGFAAGFITAMAKAMMTYFRRENIVDPEEMAATLNGILLGSLKKSKMMTAIIGRIFPEENRIQMRFAGHLPAYHVKLSGEVIEIAQPGYPLGIIKKKAPEKKPLQEVFIERGEMLVLYTDGIVEAQDWVDRLFTFEKWRDFLKNACSYTSIDDFTEAVLESIRKHTAGRPFQDDVTLFVIRRT